MPSVTGPTTNPQNIERTLWGHIKLIGALLGIMWCIEVVDTLLLGNTLQAHGMRPRSIDGLEGILTMPWLHGGWDHIAANTIPFALFGSLIILRGVRRFVAVSVIVMLTSGIAMWIAARDANHIGASGVIFGYLGYLMSVGFFERRLRSILLSIGVGFLYGGMLWGLLPGQVGVSWEGHLFGFLGGVVAARKLSYRPDPPAPNPAESTASS